MESSDAPIEQLGYSIAQACKVIPCSRSFLYRNIRDGYIRSTRHGTKVIISRQAILEFLGEAPAQAVGQ
jgi:excisionase family DNA binding protein